MKTFSIIIPVYNGDDVIGRALDSIYSQGLADEQFEVICVDDCSPTMDTWNVLNSYTYNEVHPENLKLLRHEVNKRQGAARNTALRHAEGEWILYLDADDYFVGNSLGLLKEKLTNFPNCDCLMFDFLEIKSHTIKQSIYASQNLPSEIIMSGGEFIQRYPIPWVPWLYAYKRNFLQKNEISFVEGVRFEDTDYVIKCTLYASSMAFLPLEVVAHVVNYGSTTTVGNDIIKITDLFKLSLRLRILAESFLESNRDAAMAAMNHHIYNYHSLLVRYLWRLPYKDIIEILDKYPPYANSNDKLIDLTRKHPRVYAALAQVARPFLLAAVWMKNKLK